MQFMPIALIVIIGLAIFAWYRKRKANREANPFLSSRKNKDEVWKTIKQFLKDNNEQGKEIVDSYVVKRHHFDMIDPNGSNLSKKNKTYELKIRKWQKSIINKEAGVEKVGQIPARDLFVVVFKTKDTKTNIEDDPRCFECEVINTKKSKKEYDRKIVIHGQLDYDEEMEWIAPLRAIEELKAKALEQRIAKQKAQKEKEDKKRLIKDQKRAQKIASRNAKKYQNQNKKDNGKKDSK